MNLRFWQWRYRLNLAKLTAGVASDERKRAEELACRHPPPVIPGLAFTETDVDLILLRKHATTGQISPRLLRRMRGRDLEYLAGAEFVNPVEAKDDERLLQEVKVLENGARARRILARRAAFRATVIGTTVATAVGTLLAALVIAE